MPQLNPEFFASQLFWLVITFVFLLIFLWRISLPRIGSVLEKRESKKIIFFFLRPQQGPDEFTIY